MEWVIPLVAALAAGATESAKETGATAVKDLYAGLKQKVIDYWANSGADEEAAEKQVEAKVLLDQFEKSPDLFQAPIEKKLQEVIPKEHEEEVMALVEKLNAELKAAGVAVSTGDNSVIKSKYAIAGNNNSMTINKK